MVCKTFLRKHANDLVIGVVSGLVIANVFFLNSALADVDTGPRYPESETIALMIAAMQNQTRDFGDLPIADKAAPRRTFTIPVSAYTSESAQTDGTPCIAARGFDLCENDEENVVAANFLPMGTKIRIPELYGSREFTVVDRMNKRYDRHLDIWMKSYADAKHFGVRRAMIEVL